MVHTNTMVRVQIYLSEDELALLDRAGTTSGASRSESIRRAVRHTYGERSLDDRLRALDDSAGAWADRPMAVLSTWTRYAGISADDSRGSASIESRRHQHPRRSPSRSSQCRGAAPRPVSCWRTPGSQRSRSLRTPVRRRDGELSATERLFLAFDWLPVTESVARLAGDLATWRERIGAPTKG